MAQPAPRRRRGRRPALKPLLELSRVEKTYWLGATPVRALRGVSLTIAEGEFVAIMGHSGSGKSTLMHVLGLLDAHDHGTYRVAGEDTSRLDEDARAALRARTIGFVFQQFNLLPRLTAGENIVLPLIYGHGGHAAGLAPLARTLELSHRLRHRPGELSGGQQQRVAIARALMNRPRLILADEPTGNLDSATQREIMGLLTRLNRTGLTVVLVTHEDDVARYARRVIRMRDGRIISDAGNNNGDQPSM
ncbi:MAG: ABC transporter ATP-binding protein, partial [bacterium]